MTFQFHSTILWRIIAIFLVGIFATANPPWCSACCFDDFEKIVLPYLQRNCTKCHSEARQEANFRIDNLSVDFSQAASTAHWLEVMEKITSGQMPPKDEPIQPTTEQSARVVQFLAQKMADSKATRMARREAVSFHRLSREEYANTIRDLLGIDYDVADAAGLNEDDDWNGFRRIGSVMSVSSSHIEKYLLAANEILDEAFPDSKVSNMSQTTKAISLAGERTTFGPDKFDELVQTGRAEDVRLDLWPGQEARTKPGTGWFGDSGIYRIRIKLSGVVSTDGRAPHISIFANSVDRLLFEKDIVTSEHEPTEVEFLAHLPTGFHEFTISNAVTGPKILHRLNTTRRQPFFSFREGQVPWQIPLTDENDKPIHPVLLVDSVTWEGPVVSKKRQQLRNEFRLSPGDKPQVIRAKLTRFTERAFRRPLKPGEIEPFLRLFTGEMAIGSSQNTAAKTAMCAVLCSKDFLYLVEGDTNRNHTALNDWELASRLSYFLWSTMPDDELRLLANRGLLHQPIVLKAQASRMLADPRSIRFASSFCRQWLQLNKVGQFPPDSEIYPDYDKYLERSMVKESILFFGEVLSKNLSLSEFLYSDWTMVNSRLSTHYGISGVADGPFRKVSLTDEHHRGGILTHASVLSLTSDGTRHRPVHRGVWIANSIFDITFPPPPANVEPIVPNPINSKKTTIRDKLNSHTSIASCRSCHQKIDPLGLAFDNYDAIGRWRTREKVPMGEGTNPEVDASGTLPDGRFFKNATEFQQRCLEDIVLFNKAFTKKLMIYGIRRTITLDDQTELDKMASSAKENNYRLSDLIESIIVSQLFQNR